MSMSASSVFSCSCLFFVACVLSIILIDIRKFYTDPLFDVDWIHAFSPSFVGIALIALGIISAAIVDRVHATISKAKDTKAD